MAFGYVSPANGPGGDGDGDDAAAAAYPGGNVGGPWTPLCWRYGPDQLIEMARAENLSAFRSAASMAGCHSH